MKGLHYGRLYIPVILAVLATVSTVLSVSVMAKYMVAGDAEPIARVAIWDVALDASRDIALVNEPSAAYLNSVGGNANPASTTRTVYIQNNSEVVCQITELKIHCDKDGGDPTESSAELDPSAYSITPAAGDLPIVLAPGEEQKVTFSLNIGAGNFTWNCRVFARVEQVD